MEIKLQTNARNTTWSTKSKITAEYRQKYGTNTIVLFKRGDWYVAYNECADAVVESTGITLEKRAGIRYAEFPAKASDIYFPRCLRKGYKICIIE